jgi:hypothetical protein
MSRSYLLSLTRVTALRALWMDTEGFVVSSELVMVASICVIGMSLGLASIGKQILEEVNNVNQSLREATHVAMPQSIQDALARSEGRNRNSSYLTDSQGNQLSGLSVQMLPSGVSEK